MSKIDTCKDFVSHPHMVETKMYSMENEYLGTRESGCYQCQMALASDKQGVNQIAEALDRLGIDNDIQQTGGFTMCNYIKTGEESFILGNDEGFSFMENDEDEGHSHYFFKTETTTSEKAQAIFNAINYEVSNISLEIGGEMFEFYPKKEQGAYYQVGKLGAIGEFYMPMNKDGSADVENVSEIEIEWANG